MSRIRFNNIEDVRAWKQLKKDELDLEKLKLDMGKEKLKSDIVSKVSKFIMFELALVLGQKTIFALVKKVLRGAFTASKTTGKTVV